MLHCLNNASTEKNCPIGIPADEDPLFRAQIEALKEMTAAINNSEELEK